MKPFGLFTLIAVLAMCAPLSVASENGKALYNNSCITCHGAAGEGNPVMDRFYKMRIPRMNADYIQGKSDDELKSVILNGKRKMPEAMNGLPDNLHRSKIKPEQIPDLIAFVRTLKSK